MGLNGKLVSAILLTTLLIAMLASAFSIQPVKAESATIAGTVLYNGQPVSDFTSQAAVFWARDESAGTEYPISPSYDSSTGEYSIPNMPPGEFGIEVLIDVAVPFNGEHGFAGDFEGWETTIIVPIDQQIVYVDLPVEKTIHLTNPVDNTAFIGHTEDPKDTYLPEEVIFRWDTLTEASSYLAYIDEFEEPFTFLRSVTFIQTSNLEWNVLLPISEENRFYRFYMWAYGLNDLMVGKLMVPYYDGHGWDYRFRISLIQGDLNDDGVVDIFDVVGLAKAFGSSPGDPNWNPDADLNIDGVVDIFDVVILAQNFGKTT